MPKSEYQELIAFLGRKFEEVDARLDQMATREERESQLAETRRHFEVVAERIPQPVLSPVMSGAEGPVEASAFGSRKDSAFRIPHSALEQSIRTLVPSYAFALDVHSALRIQHSAFGGFRIPHPAFPGETVRVYQCTLAECSAPGGDSNSKSAIRNPK